MCIKVIGIPKIEILNKFVSLAIATSLAISLASFMLSTRSLIPPHRSLDCCGVRNTEINSRCLSEPLAGTIHRH